MEKQDLDREVSMLDDPHPACDCGFTDFDKYRPRMSHEEVERRFNDDVGFGNRLRAKYSLFVGKFEQNHPRIYRLLNFLGNIK